MCGKNGETLMPCGESFGISGVVGEGHGIDVWLHIYDLGHFSKWLLNIWASKEDAPAVGAFHVGIEVCGVELSYEALIDDGSDPDRSGVWAHEPKRNPGYVYRESLCLGPTRLDLRDIQEIVSGLSKAWMARSYHYVSHNCVDFAEACVLALQAPMPFPQWVHGVAKGILKHTPLAHNTFLDAVMPRSCQSAHVVGSLRTSPHAPADTREGYMTTPEGHHHAIEEDRRGTVTLSRLHYDLSFQSRHPEWLPPHVYQHL
mmetsp:Transcript_93776/g.146423  ORF Transcript_93776/g.146423 Transcript_93776/m.146423 type:complete len:258 (-) Transcript_93776:7-780(-)